MMDYDKTRTDAVARKESLQSRQQDIAKEHKRLDDELEEVRRELIGLDQIIEGLDVVTTQNPPDLEAPGLSEHIRKTLQQTSVHLLPTQIRDACLAVGIKGSSMKNLLISVHNVLTRMEPSLDTAQIEGKTAYKWKVSTISLADMVGTNMPRRHTSALEQTLLGPPKTNIGKILREAGKK